MVSSNKVVATMGTGVITNRSAAAAAAARPASIPAEGGLYRGGSLASYLELPFIHKRLIIASTLIGLLCGWVAILAWPEILRNPRRS